MRQLETDLERAKRFEQEGELVLSRVDPALLATMKKDVTETVGLWEKCVGQMKSENSELKVKLTLATKVSIPPLTVGHPTPNPTPTAFHSTHSTQWFPCEKRKRQSNSYAFRMAGWCRANHALRSCQVAKPGLVPSSERMVHWGGRAEFDPDFV